MERRLIAMGELLVDLIQTDGIKSSEGPVYQAHAGGAPANVAYCVAKLGGKSLMLSKVGMDPFGDFLLRELEKGAVDTSHILRSESLKTSLALVALGANGEREFQFYRDHAADLDFDAADLDPSVFRQHDFFHFGSVNLLTPQSQAAHLEAIRLSRKAGMTVSFDPNLRYNLWDDRLRLIKTVREFVSMADIIKLSETELSALTGNIDEKAAVKKLFSGFVKLIIVTKGHKGVSLYSNTSHVDVEAAKVTAVDTTGAGDAFMGAFIFRMMQKPTLSLQVLEYLPDLIFACKVAGYVVQRHGAISAMPTLTDLDKL
jgi:fructokinase